MIGGTRRRGRSRVQVSPGGRRLCRCTPSNWPAQRPPCARSSNPVRCRPASSPSSVSSGGFCTAGARPVPCRSASSYPITALSGRLARRALIPRRPSGRHLIDWLCQARGSAHRTPPAHQRHGGTVQSALERSPSPKRAAPAAPQRVSPPMPPAIALSNGSSTPPTAPASPVLITPLLSASCLPIRSSEPQHETGNPGENMPPYPAPKWE